MDTMKFHSGYWMEYQLCGGITVELCGKLCGGAVEHTKLIGNVTVMDPKGIVF
jgi:hypothetical protein